MIQIIVAEVLMPYIHVVRMPDTGTIRDVSGSAFWTRAPYLPTAIRCLVVMMGSSIEAMVDIHFGDVDAMNVIISIVTMV